MRCLRDDSLADGEPAPGSAADIRHFAGWVYLAPIVRMYAAIALASSWLTLLTGFIFP